MTFSCPNYDLKTETCQRLNKLCVAGRPGCVLQGKVDFGEDIEVRIKRAEERAEIKRQNDAVSRNAKE
jgi:hypothetical protein